MDRPPSPRRKVSRTTGEETEETISGEARMRMMAGVPTAAEIHAWFVENTPPELYNDEDRRKALGGWHSAIPDRLIHFLPTLVREYVFDDSIAKIAGVPESTWDKWKRRGRQDHEKGNNTQEAKFYRVLQAALAELEREEIKHVRSQLPGWHARAFILERRFPKHWGRRTVVESQSRDEAYQKIEQYALDNGLDPTKLLEEMEALRNSWE